MITLHFVQKSMLPTNCVSTKMEIVRTAVMVSSMKPTIMIRFFSGKDNSMLGYAILWTIPVGFLSSASTQSSFVSSDRWNGRA